MRRLEKLIFRHRNLILIAFFLAVLGDLALRGKGLGVKEPADDWIDVAGVAVAVLGHGLRLLALRHIGPRSRTTSHFDAPRLVREGPYAVVRNPLYLGNWLIAVGLTLIAQLRWALVAGPALVFALYYVVSLAEERRLREQFGEEFAEYCRATPRFFPGGVLSRRRWKAMLAPGGHAVLRTKEYWSFVSTGACVLLIELAEHLRRASGLG